MYKRFFSIVLVCILVLGMLPIGASAETVDSGTCGPNLTWTLDEEGTLTISGTGLMDNYDRYRSKYAPWYSYRRQIYRLVLEEGIASIGSCAFYNLTAITAIDIPSTVLRIDGHAFNDCDSLRTAEIPDGVTFVSDSVFKDCDLLESVTITGDVNSLDIGIFSGCLALKSIVLSEGTETITGVLENCPSLRSVTLPVSIRSIGRNAFLESRIGRNIADVYYNGTEEDRAEIDFKTDLYGVPSTAILNATWHYAPEEPEVTEPEPTVPVPTEPEPTEPEPTEPSEPTQPTIVNAWTSDVVLAAADLMVSAPDAVLRATFTFRDDGTAATTWEAVDLTALKLYFHQMFVNAYYACGYGAGYTSFEAIENMCIQQNGMGVSEYMRNFINQYDFDEIFTPADTSGTYRISGGKLYTDMAIMAVSSDETIGNAFTVVGDTLSLNATSWGKPDFTFVCTRK